MPAMEITRLVRRHPVVQMAYRTSLTLRERMEPRERPVQEKPLWRCRTARPPFRHHLPRPRMHLRGGTTNAARPSHRPDRLGLGDRNFQFVLLPIEIPTGALADRIGPRRVLARIVLWWSALT